MIDFIVELNKCYVGKVDLVDCVNLGAMKVENLDLFKKNIKNEDLLPIMYDIWSGSVDVEIKKAPDVQLGGEESGKQKGAQPFEVDEEFLLALEDIVKSYEGTSVSVSQISNEEIKDKLNQRLVNLKVNKFIHKDYETAVEFLDKDGKSYDDKSSSIKVYFEDKNQKESDRNIISVKMS